MTYKLLLSGLLLIIALLGLGNISYGQSQTIGLLHSEAGVSDGYTLFSPGKNNKVYLIDNCGEMINEWDFSEQPGLTCYLLEDGTLLRAGRNFLEIRDWDNTLLWTYAMTANGLAQHHDIEPLPNGNILCVLNDEYTPSEVISAGRDPGEVSNTFKMDKIIELQPIGSDSAIIVWEWKFMDHLIQDFDNTKLNFGVVADKPELIDLNYIGLNISDWVHVNAVDYNADLDQILVSARHLNEIYIVDHSTTTAEAASHSGGNSNMGGDLLWRWGNPLLYEQGGTADQKLYLQHDAKWVESGFLDEGKISVFNNGGDGTGSFSSVHLIEPQISGGTYVKQAGEFLPLDYDWSWNGSILGTTVLEGKKSGAHSLTNGNFIFCESFPGQVSEITKAGDHVWTYRNPTGQTIYQQFDNITLSGNTIFRAEKYPSTYIGFQGKDLSQKGIIENQNSLSNSCIIIPLGFESATRASYTVANPIENGLLNFNEDVDLEAIVIIDLTGRVVFRYEKFRGNRLEIKLSPAMYLLQLERGNSIETRKIVVK